MTRGHNFKPHLLFPWVDEIVHSPQVLDAVEDLIGPDIRLFHLTVWPKDARLGRLCELAPGRDLLCAGAGLPRDGLGGADRCAGRGGLHGSRAGLAQARPDAARRDAGPGESAVARPGAGRRRRPHQDRLHAGRRPASSRCTTRIWCTIRGPTARHDRRIGLGISYIPTHARCTSPTRVTAMLVRGTDKYGHFDDERRPWKRAGAGRARLPREGRGDLPGDECRGDGTTK